MDNQSLQAFVTVSECASFSLAAERLHLTQSAVSKRIATLEHQAGKKLFDRIARQAKAKVLVFQKSDGFLHDDTRLFPLPNYYADIHLEPDTEMDDINCIDGVWCYTPEKLMWQKE